MIHLLPSIVLPRSLVSIYQLSHSNTKKNFLDISNIIESDKFLKIYVKSAFKAYMNRGGTLGMLGTLGWQGFRDRLAQAYIHFAIYGRFPEEIITDEIGYMTDLESRFDFISTESDCRLFMLGTFLKFCHLENSRKGESIDEFILVPAEVDEVLVRGMARHLQPDWLIVIVWSLLSVMKKEVLIDLLLKYRGDFSQVVAGMNPGDYETVIKGLLRYGHAIGDEQFFVGQKV